MGASTSVIAEGAPLAFLSANIQGLCPAKGKHKVKMLGETADQLDLGIICLTETHLCADHVEAEVAINGFVPFRSDRPGNSRRGGIILYLRDELAPGTEELCQGSNSNIEYLVLRVKTISLTVIAIYRPPMSDAENFEKTLKTIKETVSRAHGTMPTLLLTGDLNFPIVNWDSLDISGGTSSDRRQASALLNFFQEHFMEQVVRKPTRGNNILDLVATNDHELISRVEILDTPISDHKIMIITSNIYIQPTRSPVPQPKEGLEALNFWDNRVDWLGIRSELRSTDWNFERTDTSPEDMYENIIHNLINICYKYFPKKAVNTKRRIPRDRRVLMRNRCNINKKLSRGVTTSVGQQLAVKLRDIELKLVKSHEKEMHQEEQNAIDKIALNSKFFFKYARRKAHVKKQVGPLVDNEGEAHNDPKEMCTMLQQQFEAVYSSPISSIEIDEVLEQPGPRCLEDIDFTVQDVADSIMTIKPTASAGIDGVPALLLRTCAEELKEPLYQLYRKSLDFGRFPEALKWSKVVPVFKKGDRCKPENYRPISLTSHISKILEKILVKKIVEYLDSLNLFNAAQHGFRAGRSCLSQLLEHQMTIIEMLEEGKDVDVVYLDLAKAFDKVDYGILIQKLKHIGISGVMLKWIHSFLNGRIQRVHIDEAFSNWAPVLSGVPQGSSLGPLLFLIHIRDINEDLLFTRAASFADDTRIIGATQSEIDWPRVQEDLNSIYNWAEANNMAFNGNKFELLKYGGGSSNLTYKQPDGSPIKKVTHVRDLGITMTDTATFESEILEAAQQGSRQAGWIFRVFRTRQQLPLMTLYRSLVRPHLEYCCQLWSPVRQGLIGKLEGIQRSYTARMVGVGHLDYWQRLQHLKLQSLERRRERYQIIYMFKVIKGVVPNITSSRFEIKTSDAGRRGKTCMIPPVTTSASSRLKTIVDHSFAVRGARLFNALPKKLRNHEGSPESFKASLDTFLSKVRDLPCLPGYHQCSASNSLIDQVAQMRREGSLRVEFLDNIL